MRTAVVAGALAAVVLAGCGESRDLREPPPGATAPLRTTSTTVATVVPSSLPEGFLLTSPDFQPSEALPVASTCLGVGRPPSLVWSGLPDGTAELAVVVTDRTAGGAVHWLVAGIPPTETGLAPGELPAGAVQGRNAAGEVGYEPPCAEQGQQHAYDLTLYAQPVPTGLTAGVDPADALAVLEGQSTSRAILTTSVENP